MKYFIKFVNVLLLEDLVKFIWQEVTKTGDFMQ